MDAVQFDAMMARAKVAGEAERDAWRIESEKRRAEKEREATRLLDAVGLTSEQCVKLAEWLKYLIANDELIEARCCPDCGIEEVATRLKKVATP